MVEILKLERKSMEFLPENLKVYEIHITLKKIKKIQKVALGKEIMNSVEFDENINVEGDLESSQMWNNFKQSFTKDLIKKDALNKKVKDFYKMY